MAWTSPTTWVTAYVVTAADLNQELRDNLLQTAPAKASAAGDLFVGTGANALKRLAKGTARQVPQMNSGATDIEWAASPQSVLTGEADLLYASAANVLARLAKGTARQNLAMNAGATAPEWVASLQSLLTAQGDIIIASAANTPARLAKGAAVQSLVMNAGATAPEWADVFLKLAGGTMTGAIAMGTNAVTFGSHAIKKPDAAIGALQTYGLVLTYMAKYEGGAWKLAGGGSASAIGIQEGAFYVYRSQAGSLDDVITWTQQFAISAADVATILGNSVLHAGSMLGTPTGTGSAVLNESETTVTHNLGRIPVVQIQHDGADALSAWKTKVKSVSTTTFVLRVGIASSITVSYQYW